MNGKFSIGGKNFNGSIGVSGKKVQVTGGVNWEDGEGIKKNVKISSGLANAGLEWGKESDNVQTGSGFRYSLNLFDSFEVYNYRKRKDGVESKRIENGAYINTMVLGLGAVATVILAKMILAVSSASVPALVAASLILIINKNIKKDCPLGQG